MLDGFCYFSQAQQNYIDEITELPLSSATRAAPSSHAFVTLLRWILPSGMTGTSIKFCHISHRQVLPLMAMLIPSMAGTSMDVKAMYRQR